LVGSIFHMTRKIVFEMTYNVSMGTLNPTIPYHTLYETADTGLVHRVPARVLPSFCYYSLRIDG